MGEERSNTSGLVTTISASIPHTSLTASSRMLCTVSDTCVSMLMSGRADDLMLESGLNASLLMRLRSEFFFVFFEMHGGMF